MWPFYIDIQSPENLNGSVALHINLELSRRNVDLKDANGHTLLHFAAWHGLEDTAKDIIRRKASVNTVGIDGHTTLCLAAWRSETAIIEALLSNGANMVQLEPLRSNSETKRQPHNHGNLESFSRSADIPLGSES